MKALVTNWALAVGLLVPAAAVLIVVELLNVAPGLASPRLLRARRVLLVIGVVLLVLVAAVILGRFHYLRR